MCSDTLCKGSWGDLRETREKQIKVRAAMKRREQQIEKRNIREEVGSGFPAIGDGEVPTDENLKICRSESKPLDKSMAARS